MDVQPGPASAPEPALHLLHGRWVASCPNCGFELAQRHDQERAGRRRRCPICRPAARKRRPDVTSLQQLLDAERAGRDAGWIESFTSHYQRLCEQARAAGFVRLKWATAKVERANRAGAGDKGGQFNDEPPT